MSRKLRVIGLTGQTGAGKSTVSEVFQKRGFAVVNADLIARKVAEPSHPCLHEVFAAFGETVRCPDGTLNRKALAAIVFHDRAQLERLNGIMYPHITAMVREAFAEAERQGKIFALLDAPTLFESGEDALCDCIVSVIAPKDVRKQRIMARDGLTASEADARMNAQLSEEFFTEHSDLVIRNDGTIRDLAAAAENAAAQIIQQYK